MNESDTNRQSTMIAPPHPLDSQVLFSMLTELLLAKPGISLEISREANDLCLGWKTNGKRFFWSSSGLREDGCNYSQIPGMIEIAYHNQDSMLAQIKKAQMASESG